MALVVMAGSVESARAVCDPDFVMAVRADVLVGKAPLTVLFHGDAIGLHAGEVSLLWNFDDGSFGGDLQTVSHVYAKPGVYLVKLQGTHISAQAPCQGVVTTRTASISILVNEDTNQTPTARFSAQVGEGSAPISVLFTSTGSDLDGRVVLHEWSFGDGGFATGPEVLHNYQSDGTYLVRLTVTDDRGGKDFTIRNIIIGQGDNALQTNLSSALAQPTDTTSIAFQTCGGLAAPTLTMTIIGLFAMRVGLRRRRRLQ